MESLRDCFDRWGLLETPKPPQLRLYRTDYSTTNPQTSSELCNIPTEILIEISKYVFSEGVNLTYFCARQPMTPTGQDCPRKLACHASTPYDASYLSSLRTCKLLRQKLLLLLASATSLTETNDPEESKVQLAKRNTVPLADRLVSNVIISTQFRECITELRLTGSPYVIPDFSVLPNLETVTIYGQKIILTSNAAWEDESLLLLICGAESGKTLTKNQRKKTFLAYISETGYPAQGRGWIWELKNKLMAERGRLAIKVVAEFTVQGINLNVEIQKALDNGFMGMVSYDVWANSLTKWPAEAMGPSS